MMSPPQSIHNHQQKHLIDINNEASSAAAANNATGDDDSSAFFAPGVNQSSIDRNPIDDSQSFDAS